MINNSAQLPKEPDMRRTVPLVTGETYHVYTKSIYGYVIFPTDREYERMIHIMRYYLRGPQKRTFSQFIRSGKNLHTPGECGGWIDLIAYCLMPTHVHLVVRQDIDGGIEGYMQRVLNGFSQYFNRLHNRKGPLWQERFGAASLCTEQRLQEAIEYVHNNPVKDLGFRSQTDWKYSSASNDFGLTCTPPGSGKVWEG